MSDRSAKRDNSMLTEAAMSDDPAKEIDGTAKHETEYRHVGGTKFEKSRFSVGFASNETDTLSERDNWIDVEYG
jgi:hypothetical protein